MRKPLGCSSILIFSNMELESKTLVTRQVSMSISHATSSYLMIRIDDCNYQQHISKAHSSQPMARSLPATKPVLPDHQSTWPDSANWSECLSPSDPSRSPHYEGASWWIYGGFSIRVRPLGSLLYEAENPDIIATFIEEAKWLQIFFLNRKILSKHIFKKYF